MVIQCRIINQTNILVIVLNLICDIQIIETIIWPCVPWNSLLETYIMLHCRIVRFSLLNCSVEYHLKFLIYNEKLITITEDICSAETDISDYFLRLIELQRAILGRFYIH